MIPVLYKADAVTFSTFGLGVLSDCISCEVTEERNGAFELVMKYPYFISELNLTQDILAIKSLVDGVKQNLQIEPTPESGDFTHSVVALALGIASISHLNNISLPESWREQIEKKLLTIYYPEKQRNKVVDWAKANGYSTSSYLGRPIVKFKQLYLIIERTK